MANLYKYYVDEASIDWGLAWFWLSDAEIDINTAWVYWNSADDHRAIQRTMMSLQHVIDSVANIVSNSGTTWYIPVMINAMKQAWEYTTEELPVTTWESIVEAWLADDFEGRLWTIGAIDRMRQILWNEPYDLKWAARPEETPVE